MTKQKSLSYCYPKPASIKLKLREKKSTSSLKNPFAPWFTRSLLPSATQCHTGLWFQAWLLSLIWHVRRMREKVTLICCHRYRRLRHQCCFCRVNHFLTFLSNTKAFFSTRKQSPNTYTVSEKQWNKYLSSKIISTDYSCHRRRKLFYYRCPWTHRFLLPCP